MVMGPLTICIQRRLFGAKPRNLEELRKEILKKQNQLLRTSNDNLNKEMEVMTDLRNELSARNDKIEGLKVIITDEKTRSEVAWSLVEKLRQEKCELHNEIEVERDHGILLKQEMGIQEAARKRRQNETEIERDSIAGKLEKAEEQTMLAKKEMIILERDRDELKESVRELQDRIAESGEIIQFTESRNEDTVHREFSRNEEYLCSKNEEIQRLTQELDLVKQHGERQKEKLCEFEEVIEQYKRELTLLESINNEKFSSKKNISKINICTQTVGMSTSMEQSNVTIHSTKKNLTRTEKLLSLLILAVAVLIMVVQTCEEPWIQIICPKFGEVTTY